ALEAPELATDLRLHFGTDKLTVRTGIIAKLDFRFSVLLASSKEYRINPVGAAAQELILTGGLENWVRSRLGL
ncbi:MAG: homoaconitase, partial [Candidatus Zixiibacteriota bacterium]